MRAFYRFLIVLAVTMLARPGTAEAQSCHPVSPTERVTVTMTDGASVQGTLLCLNDEAVAIMARNGQMLETPLAGIRRIQTQADPVWDGAVKGAAIPLVFWAILCHGCKGAAEPMLRAAATYGLIGLTWDSLQTNRRTIYVAPARTAIGWRLRF